MRTCKKKDQPKYIVSSWNFLCRSTAASTNGVDEDWRLPSQSKLGHVIRFILQFFVTINRGQYEWRRERFEIAVASLGHLTRLILQFFVTIVSSCNFWRRSTAASTNGVEEDWRLPSQV